MTKYDHKKIESKWQKRWNEDKLYQVDLDKVKKPYYNLMMFPYPSAEGLHVGNMYAFVHSDAYGRFMRLSGYDVFEPIGLDGFGIHSENYAIKIGEHIKDVSERTEKHFYEQLHMIGNAYDWTRTVETYKPNYYKWTQWLFLQMYKKGLAFRQESSVNWCPSCKTVLSDEQVLSGHCERCDSETEKRKMKQWFWRITDYAEKLLGNLEWIDWSEDVKTIQKNWIGKSEGATVKFRITNDEFRINEEIEVFTTRPDTLFGATYFVLAPEHPIIVNLKSGIVNREEVEEYIVKAQKKSEIDRADMAKEKTGVELKGIKAINPVNNEAIPVWIADYVMMGYGTGAIMAVPAHDERDWEFAKKYKLPIKEVVEPFVIDKKYKVRKDKKTEEREVVTVIVRNPNNDTYLGLEWKTAGWKSFPTGGIDDDEMVIAAQREIKEETGYKNIKFVREVSSPIYATFYRPHKDSNVIAHFHYLLFELENEEKNEVEQHEKDLYRVVWLPRDQVANFINVVNQQIAWQRYTSGGMAYCDSGVNVNSVFLDGLKTDAAKEKMIDWLQEKKLGEAAVNYKLRDWCISRQRYWGPPIPMVKCEKCASTGSAQDGWVPVPEEDLPVLLPEMDDFLPDGMGKGPLNKIEEFVNTTCPKCGGEAKRETDVSDPFVDSSWYFMRYPGTEYNDQALDKKRLKKWMPVDMYIGGKEHSVLHLLYSRFVTIVMHELGYVLEPEPYKQFRAHGLLIRDGAKMSKSKGNVINPDEYIVKYGADAVRLYLMFLGDMRQGGDWRDSGMQGMYRFVNRVYNSRDKIKDKESGEMTRLRHKTIKSIKGDLEKLKFNTAIAKLMTLVNKIQEQGCDQDTFGAFLIMLSPFAPHIAEELWTELGNKDSIFKASWPKFKDKLAKDEMIQLVIQVNGKMRDTIETSADISEDEARKLAHGSDKIKKWIEGKEVVKEIFVMGKLVNIVVK